MAEATRNRPTQGKRRGIKPGGTVVVLIIAILIAIAIPTFSAPAAGPRTGSPSPTSATP